MKNARRVSGVTIKRTEGRIEYHIPSTMTGKAFEAWKNENRQAIDQAIEELNDEGDTSTPE